MAVEEATEAQLPFGMGEVDLMSTGAIFAVVSLILGFAVFSMTQSIGDYVASQANSFAANYLGFNPSTGKDSSPDMV
jgi:hypothetical protein